MKSLTIIIISVLLFYSSSFAANEEFPGRKLYLAVPYIELNDAYQQREQFVFVDVRSSYEYETLRIKGAVHIPLADKNFIEKMKALREKEGSKKIVVYCNGKTCMKSYKAASKCRKFNINNVVAYDAGVLDWAKTYPQEAVLLGESPIDPARLIDKARFKKHLITSRDFEHKVGAANTLVLDVRDPFQREGISIFVGKEERVSLDDKQAVERYLDKAKRENRTLLVYDAAGKQVRWLMYHIEQKGVASYYFMNGGAHSYFADLRKEFVQ